MKPGLGKNRFGGQSITYWGLGMNRKWMQLDGMGDPGSGESSGRPGSDCVTICDRGPRFPAARAHGDLGNRRLNHRWMQFTKRKKADIVDTAVIAPTGGDARS